MIYIFDIDGTMCDNEHRQHLIPPPEKKHITGEWVAFNAACAEDTPRWTVINLAYALIQQGADVRFLTGRGKSAHNATLTQLSNWLSRSRTLLSLHMRPMDDYRTAAEYKTDVVRKWREKDSQILVFEDDPTIVEALRQIDGVTVLQIDSACAAVKAA